MEECYDFQDEGCRHITPNCEMKMYMVGKIIYARPASCGQDKPCHCGFYPTLYRRFALRDVHVPDV